jgi:Vacuolar sorting 38 and autophagy-related subunit 14
MNCEICHRAHSAKKLPFLCVVDARNRLYEGRVEFAQALIQTEEAERQANAALVSQAEATHESTSALRAKIDRIRSEEGAAADRTSQIIAQADRLKAEIDAARKEIERKKDAIARKTSSLASVSSGSPSRRNRQLEEIERSMQRTKYKWNRSADTMAATRAFLCEEAARLYGLRQVKKGSAKRYEIGGVEIVELHAMNSKLGFCCRVGGIMAKLTDAGRCGARGDIDVACPHCTHIGSGIALFGDSTAVRDHVATSGLPAANHLLACLIVQAW